MSFSDLNFCLKFLPIFIIAYLLVPNRGKNIVAIFGSIIFYAIGGWQYLPALIISFFVNFIFVKFFIKRRKFICALSLMFNLLLIISFRLIGHPIPGMSFVGMEMMALSIDVCRGNTSVKSFRSFATYFFCFPKLLSGPITTYPQMKEQIRFRKVNLQGVEEGFGVFVLGLGYKILLADQLKGIWNGIVQIGVDSISFYLAWLGLLAISLNIYFDFQGYSLMAIGIGRMLGFTLPENFSQPYTSKTVSEFYRRWHMTLGAWYKNYLYIPLGGSKKSKFRTIFNIFIVWVATYLWHGFSMHFFAWAMFLCAFIIIEKLFWGKVCDKLKILPHIYVLLVIGVSWMFFYSRGLHESYHYLKRLLAPLLALIGKGGGIYVNQNDYLIYLRAYGYFLVPAIILCCPKVEQFLRNGLNKWWGKLIALALLVASVYFMHINENNPFMYSQF